MTQEKSLLLFELQFVFELFKVLKLSFNLELVEQNKILHNQIQSLSGRMVELQSQQSPMSTPTKSLYASRDPVAVATAAVESGDSQSNSQLLDVIKFLRREKEISDTKSEVGSNVLIVFAQLGIVECLSLSR